MIGRKEMALIANGKKLVNKHKDNFSRFTEHDFFVRVILVDKNTGKFAKAIECIVNSGNWMDYVTAADFGDYKVDKVEFSASGR